MPPEDTVKNQTGQYQFTVGSRRALMQNTGAYELIPANYRSFSSGGGGTGGENRMFKVNSGTGSLDYGAIQSFRSLNYRAGETAVAKMAGYFPNGGVAGYWQGIGLIAIGDELAFGYSGTDFGIWHRYGGIPEVRTLTFTTQSSASTDLTLTLAGTAYTIPLTNQGSLAGNAAEVADWLNDAANQSAWRADQVGATVVMVAQADGAKTGTFSFSHATAAGSIALTKTGVAKTSTHIKQENWNEYTFPDLDPTKGNSYQIVFSDAFSKTLFFIKDTSSGEYRLVHAISALSESTTLNLGNPSMRLGMYTYSVGGTGTDVEVFCSELSAFVDGMESSTRNPRTEQNEQAVGTTFTNVLTIRNRRTYNAFANQQEIEPVYISISNESTKNVEVEIRGNASPSGSNVQNFSAIGTNLISLLDTSSIALSGGRFLAGFSVAGGDGLSESLRPFEIRVPPSLNLCVLARVTSGSTANVSVSITWIEEL